MIAVAIPKPIPVANLTTLNFNGYWKNRIVVSNSPDATQMDFDFESTIYRNWPSQSHHRYRHGFIQFNNGKRFDRYRQTIAGVPKFLFDYDEVRAYWEVCQARKRLVDSLNALSDTDLRAAAELIVPLATTATGLRGVRGGRAWVETEVAGLLPALGLAQLRDLTALLTIPTTARQTNTVAA
jgi:hypothetical protein